MKNMDSPATAKQRRYIKTLYDKLGERPPSLRGKTKLDASCLITSLRVRLMRLLRR